MMQQDDEHVEQTEGRRRHDEEVDGDKVQDVVLEERSPGLRGWLRAARHETRNGPLRNLEAELEQLAMNARGRPGYKFHPRVDGVRRTRDRLSSVRFRDGRGSRSPPRRPGRGERASSSAAYRRRAEARRSCSVDSLAALDDCPHGASGASLA